jgi:hypothetical protein
MDKGTEDLQSHDVYGLVPVEDWLSSPPQVQELSEFWDFSYASTQCASPRKTLIVSGDHVSHGHLRFRLRYIGASS